MGFFENEDKKIIQINIDEPFERERNKVRASRTVERPFKEAWWFFFLGAGLVIAIYFLITSMNLFALVKDLPGEIITLSSFITAISLGILVNKARGFYETSMEAYKELVASNDMILLIISTVKNRKLRNKLFDVLKYVNYTIFLSISQMPFRVITKNRRFNGRSIYNLVLAKLVFLAKKAGIERDLGWSSAGLFRLTTARSHLLTNVRFVIRPGYYIMVFIFFFVSHILVTIKMTIVGFNLIFLAVLMGVITYGMGIFLYVSVNESHPCAMGGKNIDLNRRYNRFLNKADEMEEISGTL